MLDCMGGGWDAFYRDFRAQLLRSLSAAAVFMLHSGVAALILVLIWAIELLIATLWPSKDPTLFGGLLPLKWVFDLIKLAMLSVWGWWGCVEAWKTFSKAGSNE